MWSQSVASARKTTAVTVSVTVTVVTVNVTDAWRSNCPKTKCPKSVHKKTEVWCCNVIIRFHSFSAITVTVTVTLITVTVSSVAVITVSDE